MSDSGREHPAVDRLFAALSHPTRRSTLVFLNRASVGDSGWIPLETLAVELAEPETVVEQLYHVHLPQLDGVDLVEWDHERELVRRGPRFETVTPVLELLEQLREEFPDE
ncbi:DUF7344 domain-containing protein [Haloprofundus halobius]|uniref:DUF7344 domain-containing protein n=1 Tax=Haloprofundus halobius TaxID=2876194 RepID=UPI001CC8FC32|nr:hypothetical protein [Haloprofundus halobius]